MTALEHTPWCERPTIKKVTVEGRKMLRCRLCQAEAPAPSMNPPARRYAHRAGTTPLPMADHAGPVDVDRHRLVATAERLGIPVGIGGQWIVRTIADLERG